MVDGGAPGRVIGYCTNVHAGETLARVQANLKQYAVAVRDLVSPDAALGIGLWLSHRAARRLREKGVADFAGWLAGHGLRVFTVNGFPYGDFHGARVKHEVYRPDWREAARLEYTLDLAAILSELTPAGGSAGISTLPLGWGPWLSSPGDLASAAANLRGAAAALARLHDRTGTLIHLDLEPEPGCALQRSGDMANLFRDHLLPGADHELIRRHVRVCHDVCHAAVMFEPQSEALNRYDALGVAVGKVQVSSAVRASFDRLVDADRGVALEQLARLAEPRYLHQTVVRSGGRDDRFFEDLPDALAAAGSQPSGEWRIHHHVPIFLEGLGLLETTRDQIDQCLELIAGRADPPVLEVETYTWDVLPAPLREAGLAEGIAREIEWLTRRAAAAEPTA